MKREIKTKNNKIEYRKREKPGAITMGHCKIRFMDIFSWRIVDYPINIFCDPCSSGARVGIKFCSSVTLYISIHFLLFFSHFSCQKICLLEWMWVAIRFLTCISNFQLVVWLNLLVDLWILRNSHSKSIVSTNLSFPIPE